MLAFVVMIQSTLVRKLWVPLSICLLLFGEAIFPICAQVTVCQPLPPDLIAWYRLDQNPSDAIGRYPGVNVGSVVYEKGKQAGSAGFSKIAGIRVGNAPGLQPQQLTVSAWIKSKPPGSYKYVVSKSLDRNLAASVGLYSSSDGLLRFYVCHRLSPLQTTFSSPAAAGLWDDAWHWVVGTYDGKTAQLYVDGKPTGAGGAGGLPILYGSSAFNGDWFIGNGEMPTPTPRISLLWPGLIDEVQIYNRALSGAEVSERFAEGADGFCIEEGRPVFLSLPPSQSFAVGKPLTLKVSVGGNDPMRLQWRKNGRPIDGATQESLVFPVADIDDGGNYQIVASNPLGTVVSDPIPLFPALAVLPANDVFLRAGVFSGLSGVGVTTNRLATSETGEPAHAGKRGGRSVWLRYLATETGLMTVSTRGSDFDTLLAAYDGDAVERLTVKAASDDEPGRVTSLIRFPVRKGRTYRFAVDGRGGAVGAAVFRWNLEPTAAELLEIVRQPVSRTIHAGGLAIFNVGTIGARSFQWYRNGTALRDNARVEGATKDQLVIRNVDLADLGVYEAEVGDGVTLLRTERATLQINPAAVGLLVETFGVADKLIDVIDDLPARLPASGRSGGRALPAGLAIGSSGTQIFNNSGASADPEEPVHCGVGSGRSQWLAYQAAVDGLMIFDTAGSDFDTVLAIYRDTGAGTGLYDGLVSIGCNDNATLDVFSSRVVVSMEKGVVYYVAVDRASGASEGNAVLSYRPFTGVRLVTRQPQNPGELLLTIEGVTGTSLDLQSSSGLPGWSTLFSTNAPSDQLGVRLPVRSGKSELFRVLLR